MSFILKALKKVEEEKAARNAGPADLHTALTTDSGSKKVSSRGFVLAAAMILTLAAAAAMAWKSMKPASIPTVENIIKTASSGQSGPAEQPQPAASPEPVRVPAPAQVSTRAPAPTTSPAPAPPGHTAASEVPEPAAAPRKTGHDTPRKQTATRKHPEPTGTAPDNLTVNGIAFQDDPAESMAVVNGILVHRGMEVKGMRVDEIFRDRVRFSGRNGTFDLKLSK